MGNIIIISYTLHLKSQDMVYIITITQLLKEYIFRLSDHTQPQSLHSLVKFLNISTILDFAFLSFFSCNYSMDHYS